jgi:uncharacterized protein
VSARVKARLGVAVLAFVACAAARSAMAADFTVPPTPNQHVTDDAGALSGSARSSIENDLQAYERATGHQIVVWIGETTGEVPLETWTSETADRWKIGRHGHDDGAVLFLFMKDRKVRIEVGYGLESSLTDADAHRIIADVIVPRMRSGNVDGAVTSGVAAMLTTITPSYKGVTPPPAEAESGNLSTGEGLLILAVIVFGFGFIIFLVIMQVIGTIRYGYLVTREGSTRAKADMRRWWFWSGAALGASSGGGGFSGGSDDGDFSAGGGSFGGGGASGGW